MVAADEVSRRAMEAANMSKEEGIVVMPTTILDPPEAGGVEAVPRTGQGNPLQNVGIVARKATRIAGARRSVPIRRKSDPDPDLDELYKEIGNDRTTPKDRKDPKKLERGQSL